jgi:SAM-dependent methyltransferase
MRRAPAPLTVPSQYFGYLEKRLGFSLPSPSRRDLEPIIRRVASLSERFIDREKTHDVYLDDPQDRLAYLVYYTTVNLLKFFFPLGEIRFATRYFDSRSVRILDVGCGTGSALLGFMFWYGERFGRPVEATAIDHSPHALQELQKDVAELFPESRLHVKRVDLGSDLLPSGPFDLILIGNVINEMSDGGLRLLQKVRDVAASDGWVIIVEPALLRTSRGLLRLRDLAVESGWTVFAPCTRQSHCPALAKDTDWCHHELTWQRPEFIRRIDENLGMIKKSLKFSYLTLNQAGLTMANAFPHGTDIYRMVSERFDEKGRTRFFLCGTTGRHGFIRNRRDRRPVNQDADRLERYDLVTCSGCEFRENDVSIGKESGIQLRRGGSAIDE